MCCNSRTCLRVGKPVGRDCGGCSDHFFGMSFLQPFGEESSRWRGPCIFVCPVLSCVDYGTGHRIIITGQPVCILCAMCTEQSGASMCKGGSSALKYMLKTEVAALVCLGWPCAVANTSCCLLLCFALLWFALLCSALLCFALLCFALLW
jgi:hypothetical protein